jgi:hypothetical protein
MGAVSLGESRMLRGRVVDQTLRRGGFFDQRFQPGCDGVGIAGDPQNFYRQCKVVG